VAPGRWKVEHNCPQCGGPVALKEDERILTSDYCRVKLFVANDGGPLRYCLPARNADVGSIVMVPYWRVRGQAYRGEGLALAARALDDTRLASPAPGLPLTLGVRPQAMALRFASADLGDRFVSPSVAPRFSAERRTKIPNARLIDDAFFDIPLVPMASLVYLPVRLKRGVYDAVASRRIGALDADDWLPLVGPVDAKPPSVRFLSTLCPWCSWQLDSHPESLVLTCSLCRSAYTANAHGLCDLGYSVLAASNWEPACHVPFWRVRAEISGADLASWADFVRFSNLPIVNRRQWQREPIDFWVPAFGTSPDQFLRFSRTMTIARPNSTPAGRQHEGKPMAEPWPVTLPPSCLGTAVKILLADVGHPRTTVFPLIGELGVKVTSAELVYIPLADGGTELAHPGIQLVVQKKRQAAEAV
jgi:hypothetical protein